MDALPCEPGSHAIGDVIRHGGGRDALRRDPGSHVQLRLKKANIPPDRARIRRARKWRRDVQRRIARERVPTARSGAANLMERVHLSRAASKGLSLRLRRDGELIGLREQYAARTWLS